MSIKIVILFTTLLILIEQTSSLTVAPSYEEAYIRLDKSNFDWYVNSPNSGAWFIMFHTFWCHHCIQAMPIWKQFSTRAEGARIGMVNCEENFEFLSRFHILGYPSFIYFSKGRMQHYDSNSPRTVEAWSQFLKDQLEQDELNTIEHPGDENKELPLKDPPALPVVQPEEKPEIIAPSSYKPDVHTVKPSEDPANSPAEDKLEEKSESKHQGEDEKPIENSSHTLWFALGGSVLLGVFIIMTIYCARRTREKPTTDVSNPISSGGSSSSNNTTEQTNVRHGVANYVQIP